MEQYETADTSVSITKNNQNINITLKPNFGILSMKTAYSNNIGANENWSLTINNKTYYSFENRFSPGAHDVKLSHKCYEDINFKAGINKGKTEVFNMQEHVKLKQGGLSLRAEQDGLPVGEPVFVNGKHVGETPFSGSMPVCSEVRVGNERANVELEYKQTVKYTHKMPDSKERKRKMENERARREKEEEEAKKTEEERRMEEEEERRYEKGRTSWMLSSFSAFGYSRLFNMNEIAPYFKPSGWHLSFISDYEIHKRNIGFLRFGLDFGISGIDIDRDALREIRDIPADTKIDGVVRSHINVLARLYPAKYLFLSGGVGLEGYNNLETGNAEVAFSELVFPVGGGVFLCKEEARGWANGIAIEALYKILPLKERSAAYISVNFKHKFFEWKYVKREKKVSANSNSDFHY
jgi:hypothetical protein